MAGIPLHITPLAYIRGSGSQYITTAINLRSTDVVKSKWRFENSAGNVYGCFTSSSGTDNFCLYAGSSSTDAYIRYNGQLVRDFRPANGSIHELEQGPGGFFDNGTKLTDFTPATFTCTAPMYLFMLPNSSSAKITARCYGLTVFRDGEQVCNFIPARNELTGEVGFYESVGGVFYENDGTGNFTAGPEVNFSVKTLLLKRRRALLGAAKHYDPIPGSDGMIWAYFITTSDSASVKILNNTTGISQMIVDGVAMTPSTANYTFAEAGEHLVKYQLNGTALYATFRGVNPQRMVFPANVTINTTTSGLPFTNYNPKSFLAIGPINDYPFRGYISNTGVNSEIEVNGLQNWSYGYYPNCIKSLIVRGIFTNIPAYGLMGFNGNNDFRNIWVESPNLATINTNNLRNMSYVQTIVFNVSTPPVWSASPTWSSMNATFKFYVPYSEDHSILNAWKTASGWSTKASQMYELNPDGTIPSE